MTRMMRQPGLAGLSQLLEAQVGLNPLVPTVPYLVTVLWTVMLGTAVCDESDQPTS